MKKLLILFSLMFVIFACSNDCLNVAAWENNNNGNKEEPAKRFNTLQDVVNNANAGEEIDLSDYELTDYTATINKKLTIKNGSLSNAKLQVKSEGVKLEKLTDLSVSTSSRLTITESKLSDLLIGGNGETSRSTVVAVDMSVAMVSVTDCEIENVSLDGFNSQLNITDKTTKIDDIVISAKSKIILEAGSYEGMKDPKVVDGGEAVRVDMTKDVEFSILSIYSYPQKLEYNVGEKIDLTGLVVMGTYSTTCVETFKSGGKSVAVDMITKYEEDEKDYTVEYDFSTAGVSIVTIKSTKYPEIKCNFHVFVKEPQNAGEEKPEEKIEFADISLEIFGPAKTTYGVGERLDLSCYQVVGKYNDFEINLPYTSEPANGAVLATEGEVTITFYYDGGTLTNTIKVVKSWTVTFKDGNDILHTTKVVDGDKLTQLPVAPSKTGYEFVGWYNGDNEFKDGDSVISDLELTAKWEKICSVILMVNGQQSIMTGKYGENVEIPDPKELDGYTFTGWNPPLPETYSETYSETSLTHTAIFKAIAYTITYENCDGVNKDEYPKTYNIEEEKKLVEPTKDGYRFVGWYTNKECTEENKITQINKGTTGDITLYAVWKVTTFYVGGTSTDETATGTQEAPFTTMQEAVNKINEVNDGQTEYTIKVLNDINPSETTSYDENNNYSLININPDKALTLKICGTQNADGTYPTISASGDDVAQGRVMYIGGTITVTLENITLTGGVNNKNGGGVYIAGNCTLNMNSGATIEKCEAGYGGGVYIEGTGTLNMNSGASIKECEAPEGRGGGVYVAIIGNFTMSDSASIKNCAVDNGDGGGVYVNGGTFTMSDSASIKNCAVDNGDGGGVYVAIGTFTMSGSANIESCRVISLNPSILCYGGGVYIAGNGTLNMNSGATIEKCEAPENYGGGVCVEKNGTLNMTGGATIKECKAGLGGGVFLYDGSTFAMSGSANIESCSVTSESGYDTRGGGVYVGGGTFIMSDRASIKNCYATNTNTEKECDGGGVYVTFSGEFIMSGGEISGCNAQKNGGGVWMDDGTFEILGSAVVASGNDVYLSDVNATVTIAGELNPPEGTSTVARITPSTYSTGTQVLSVKDDVSVTLENVVGKFAVTPSADGNTWSIDSEGKLKKQ